MLNITSVMKLKSLQLSDAKKNGERRDLVLWKSLKAFKGIDIFIVSTHVLKPEMNSSNGEIYIDFATPVKRNKVPSARLRDH